MFSTKHFKEMQSRSTGTNYPSDIIKLSSDQLDHVVQLSLKPLDLSAHKNWVIIMINITSLFESLHC